MYRPNINISHPANQSSITPSVLTHLTSTAVLVFHARALQLGRSFPICTDLASLLLFFGTAFLQFSLQRHRCKFTLQQP